jgi:hypothetical protein
VKAVEVAMVAPKEAVVMEVVMAVNGAGAETAVEKKAMAGVGDLVLETQAVAEGARVAARAVAATATVAAATVAARVVAATAAARAAARVGEVRAVAALVAGVRVGAARAAAARAVARVETYSGRHSRSSPCPSRTAPARRTCL